MKDAKDVIQEFNELVNMTASELETWLKSDESGEAGWPKDGSGDETVGHESGRKITEILKSNPSKNPQKYDDDQISHMRKVVAYCKRHLAQEEVSLKSKSEAEAKKTKSYISLKNWGHDPLKKNSSKKANKGDGDEQSQEEQENGEKQEENKEEENGEKEEENEEPGDKRKRSEKGGGPEPKKHRGGKNSKEDKSDSKDEASDESEDNKKATKQGNKSKSSNGPNPGETVSWNWGNGQPEGKVLDVKEEKATITTKRGNQVSRKGSRKDPAVILDTGKSKAIKSAHELN
ncbi:DNA-binding protein [Cordyceps fumosorosea ARSEF 2679]|uniref:DNA-binding protein n=1 Tax=Cordyceps fumosorosea (strain ARSEF 2679) TaxID=1081104 RepID=A0A168EQW1_CORFA|nr:DNA-binding protein [Cordyceps fumosorosea ARSEF 2679]OAA74110.1 DNA-binding protein [Cordyceps fumosorosea ARSEF 2679]